jgi:two-component system sensor histidine kinase BarA
LFQAFSQADNSLSRQPGGTGLGLVISKRLIEQMGGEIGVDSIPEEGSEFWISLSLPKARDDIEDLPRAALIGRRVGLLEQHPLARQALQHQLESCGLNVLAFDTLDNLQEAVAIAHTSDAPIDIAVLGVTYREIAPQQLCQRLWEFEALGCKCIVLCPTSEQAQYHEALPESHTHAQLQSKPACTRKLQRVLLDLLRPPQMLLESISMPETRPPRVLCVDDNPANLLLLETLLTDMGGEAEAVSSGQEALAAVKRKSFDLVFMDVQMPGMDGRQTTEAIRQWEVDSGQPPLPVIALTAHALSNEKRSLLQSGLDDYLTKPISERQLAQVILKWTGLPLSRSFLAAPVEVLLPDNNLKVLDAEEGLRLAAGKADLAADMMSMLLASLEDDRRAIRDARLVNDRQAMIDRVHRLHGATRYCGVPQLRAACERSETLLKQNHPSAAQAMDELDSAIERLEFEARVV